MREIKQWKTENFPRLRVVRRRCLAACVGLALLLGAGAASADAARVLTCTLQESEGHRHTDECYGPVRGGLICTETDPAHTHTDACYAWITGLTCGLQEGAGAHHHTQACYRYESAPIEAGENEGDAFDVLEPWELEQLGRQEQAPAWESPRPGTVVGTPSALAVVRPGAEEEDGEEAESIQRPIPQVTARMRFYSPADMSAGGWDSVGGDGIYSAFGGSGVSGGAPAMFYLPESYGSLDPSWSNVFRQWSERSEETGIPLGPTSVLPEQMMLVFDEKSDPTADLETEEDWDEMFEDMKLSGSWAKDLITVAESQLGYTESTSNYARAYDGSIKGYTRYGAWYGIPYGDWCAMFISFCLHYAHVPWTAMPYSCHCVVWTNELDALGLFHRTADEEDDYEPKPGDLIFFDYDLDGRSDHAGIVVGLNYEANTIYTIEGNRFDYVEQFELIRNDYMIMGYGEMPENPTGKVLPISSRTVGEPGNPVQTGTGAQAQAAASGSAAVSRPGIGGTVQPAITLTPAGVDRSRIYYPPHAAGPRVKAGAEEAEAVSANVLEEVIRVKTADISPVIEHSYISAKLPDDQVVSAGEAEQAGEAAEADEAAASDEDAGESREPAQDGGSGFFEETG